MNLLKKDLWIAITIIIFSFFISVSLSKYYLKKFDNYDAYQKNNHPMIKIAVKNHWYEASKILSDFNNGKSFLKSGNNNLDEFLPPKILSLYYIFIGDKIYHKKNIIKTNNGKLTYLILKSFFYFFFIFILYLNVVKIFNKRISLGILIYLCFLPDIIQYHSSFWNESLTFIFQVILIIFIINFKYTIKKNFILGVVAALPFLTGQEYLFYFFVFTLYYLFIYLFYKKNTFKYFLSFVAGYLSIFAIVLIVSYQKNNEKSLNLYGLKSALYIYIVPDILSKKNEITIQEAKKIMNSEAVNWAKTNKINFKNSGDFLLIIRDDDFADKIKYNNYIFNYSLKSIFLNFHYVFTQYLKSSLHTLVLNPFFIDAFYNFDSIDNYLKSSNHHNLIKYRILYSLVFYSLLFFGFMKCIKYFKPEFTLILTLLIFYNILILGWLGSPRYFAPSLIYSSFFFSAFFIKRSWLRG